MKAKVLDAGAIAAGKDLALKSEVSNALTVKSRLALGIVTPIPADSLANESAILTAAKAIAESQRDSVWAVCDLAACFRPEGAVSSDYAALSDALDGAYGGDTLKVMASVGRAFGEEVRAIGVPWSYFRMAAGKYRGAEGTSGREAVLALVFSAETREGLRTALGLPAPGARTNQTGGQVFALKAKVEALEAQVPAIVGVPAVEAKDIFALFAKACQDAEPGGTWVTGKGSLESGLEFAVRRAKTVDVGGLPS